MCMHFGLPARVRACLFDLDGVLTATAKVHAAAWKAMFDAYLDERARATGTPFVPFDARADYELYVDGKPRADGIRSFLAARGIRLPEGQPSDPPDAETVRALGDRKTEIFERLLRETRGLPCTRGRNATFARFATRAYVRRSSRRAATQGRCSPRPP